MPKYCCGRQHIAVLNRYSSAEPEPLKVFTSLRVITYFQNVQIGNDETKNINSHHPALDAGSVGDLK